MSQSFLRAASARAAESVGDSTAPLTAAGDQRTAHRYRLSPELRHLVGIDADPADFSSDELIQMLLAHNALSVAAPTTSGNRWQAVLRAALNFRITRGRDSWAKYEIHHRKTELAMRWDYDAGRGVWESSETLIKMEDVPFAHGAMRECFRMKKMSQVNAAFFYKMKWEECNNYVAKSYLAADTPRETYFSDIEMQMISKRFARLYTAKKPPKKVDFLQAFVIEIVRDGVPVLFCVERAIEAGDYTKHNNNSGFVEVGADEEHAYRATPNAFSRFTFHASGGTKMIIDIQGVDDVYTDPQIHTAAGSEYGEGNLGVGGMALFFSTSGYDSLCRCLALPDFCLAAAERERIHTNLHSASPRSSNVADDDDDATVGSTASCKAMTMLQTAHKRTLERREQLTAQTPLIGSNELAVSALPLTLLSEDAAGCAAREAGGLPAEGMSGVPPPSDGGGAAPIGLVHARLAEYNLVGSLPLLRDQPDVASAGHHLVCACAANEPRALRDLRALVRGMSADELLPGVCLDSPSDELQAWIVPVLTTRLAHSGDATAMLEAANNLAASGANNAPVRAAAWVHAALEAVAKAPAKQQIELQLGGCAPYSLYQRLAELQLEGGDEVAAGESYAAASEAAMEAGKAKIAMKLQMLAEQYVGD